MTDYKVRVDQDGMFTAYPEFSTIENAHHYMVKQAFKIANSIDGFFDFGLDTIDEMFVYKYDGDSDEIVARLEIITDAAALALIEYEKEALLWLTRTKILSECKPNELPAKLQHHLKTTVILQQLYTRYVQLKEQEPSNE